MVYRGGVCRWQRIGMGLLRCAFCFNACGDHGALSSRRAWDLALFAGSMVAEAERPTSAGDHWARPVQSRSSSLPLREELDNHHAITGLDSRHENLICPRFKRVTTEAWAPTIVPGTSTLAPGVSSPTTGPGRGTTAAAKSTVGSRTRPSD
jgi:hypothetical protein